MPGNPFDGDDCSSEIANILKNASNKFETISDEDLDSEASENSESEDDKVVVKPEPVKIDYRESIEFTGKNVAAINSLGRAKKMTGPSNSPTPKDSEKLFSDKSAFKKLG